MLPFDVEKMKKMAMMMEQKRKEEEEDGIDVDCIPSAESMRNKTKPISKKELIEFIDLYQEKVGKMMELKKKMIKTHKDAMTTLHARVYKKMMESDDGENKWVEMDRNPSSTHTAKQISNMLQFQAKLLQRVKEQKQKIEEMEAEKKLNKELSINKLISSPFEFLYFMYAPSHCKPFENMNKISIVDQINLMKYHLLHTVHYKTMEFVEPFIDSGMIELNKYERAASFYYILFQFIKDNELFVSCKDVSKWDEFHISRSLYLPMEQFMNLFDDKIMHNSLFCFIYDLLLWIIEQQYDFKKWRHDFVKYNNTNNDFAEYMIKCVYPNITDNDINKIWIEYLNNHWTPNLCLKRIEKHGGNKDDHWTLIFRHKLYNKNNDNDDDKENFFEYDIYTKNLMNPMCRLYSVLDSINYDFYRDNNDRLILLMLWPNISNIDNKYQCEGMIWYQNSTPMNESVDQYQQIMVPYPGSHNCQFGGIRKSAHNVNNKCLCNGNNGNSWWYCIGSLVQHNNNNNIGIPGPIVFERGVVVQHTELYIFDIQSAIKDYSKNIIIKQCNWITIDIAIIISQMIYDRTYIIKQSLNKLYPLTLDME